MLEKCNPHTIFAFFDIMLDLLGMLMLMLRLMLMLMLVLLMPMPMPMPTPQMPMPMTMTMPMPTPTPTPTLTQTLMPTPSSVAAWIEWLPDTNVQIEMRQQLSYYSSNVSSYCKWAARWMLAVRAVIIV